MLPCSSSIKFPIKCYVCGSIFILSLNKKEAGVGKCWIDTYRIDNYRNTVTIKSDSCVFFVNKFISRMNLVKRKLQNDCLHLACLRIKFEMIKLEVFNQLRVTDQHRIFAVQKPAF